MVIREDRALREERDSVQCDALVLIAVTGLDLELCPGGAFWHTYERAPDTPGVVYLRIAGGEEGVER